MFWTEVLDDLEARVAAAEAGDLDALGGWVVPGIAPRPMDAAETTRAAGIVERQRTLMASLKMRQAQVAAAMGRLRRPQRQFRVAAAAPVYIDRLG